MLLGIAVLAGTAVAACFCITAWWWAWNGGQWGRGKAIQQDGYLTSMDLHQARLWPMPERRHGDARLRLLIRRPVRTAWQAGMVAALIFAGLAMLDAAPEDWLVAPFVAVPLALGAATYILGFVRLHRNRMRINALLTPDDRFLASAVYAYCSFDPEGPARAWLTQRWDLPGSLDRVIEHGLIKEDPPEWGTRQGREPRVQAAFTELDGDAPFMS